MELIWRYNVPRSRVPIHPFVLGGYCRSLFFSPCFLIKEELPPVRGSCTHLNSGDRYAFYFAVVYVAEEKKDADLRLRKSHKLEFVISVNWAMLTWREDAFRKVCGKQRFSHTQNFTLLLCYSSHLFPLFGGGLLEPNLVEVPSLRLRRYMTSRSLQTVVPNEDMTRKYSHERCATALPDFYKFELRNLQHANKRL